MLKNYGSQGSPDEKIFTIKLRKLLCSYSLFPIPYLQISPSRENLATKKENTSSRLPIPDSPLPIFKLDEV
ncbi:hypothetical protein [Calothrix rhizosoleniae]|uniref:hypothetical protein n=1 Tax=Calothrix rhizosoleniae TaxID=888997 RepID=UPI000B497C20|nr:hypothetical protein [Calothrix rhizosoleniae]